METPKIITGNNTDEIWQQIYADLNTGEDVYDYDVIIAEDDKRINLIIEIDLGGGFEGGYANTGFNAQITHNKGFTFAVHPDGFIDDIGKFLGMQDVEVGYPELDHHLIIKTNDEEKVKSLFTDSDVRSVLETLEDFDLGIHLHHVGDNDVKHAFLELNIDDGITDPAELRKLYNAFYTILNTIDNF